MAHAYNRLNVIALNRSSYEEAIRTAVAGINYAEKIKNPLRLADLYANLGRAYLSTSQYQLSIDTYRRALEISDHDNNRDLSARITGQLGIAYKELTDYTTALEYFVKALDLEKELEDKNGIATNTINIAVVYQAFGNHERALESFQQALSLFEEIGEHSAVAFSLSSIGALYFRIHEYEKALDIIGRALKVQLELGERRDAAVSRGNMGHAYKSLGDYDKALEYLTEALRESVEIGVVYPQLHWLNGLGDLFAERAYAGYSPEIAESYLKQAVDLSTKHGIKSITMVAYESLDSLYKQIGEWEKAYEARDQYEKLKEQINVEGAQRQAAKLEMERKEAERERHLAAERARAQEKENILNNILPEGITARIINGESPIADHLDAVSILFMDIVDFTRLSSNINAQQLVHLLNAIFTAADGVMREFGLEKIKTIGDAYMAVAGAPIPQEDHAERAAQAALKLLHVMNNLVVEFPDHLGDRSWITALPEIHVRIGLNCGPAAAGVVGENKFLYDLWGDAVNTASRMESYGVAGRIHCTEEFVAQLQARNSSCTFIPRGEIEVKGKGVMRTYFIE